MGEEGMGTDAWATTEESSSETGGGCALAMGLWDLQQCLADGVGPRAELLGAHP